MVASISRLTSPQTVPNIDFCVSEAAESLSELHIFTDPAVRCKDYEIGCAWFDDVRTSASSQLTELLAPFHSQPGSSNAWCALDALVAEAPADVPGFLDHLEAMPPDEVWLELLGFHLRPQPCVRGWWGPATASSTRCSRFWSGTTPSSGSGCLRW